MMFLARNAVLLIALSISPSAAGQAPGAVRGVVVDAGSGTPLEGVNLYVEGTPWGGATDTLGRFSITGVAPGRHVLVASRVGYETWTRPVRVAAGETADVRVRLRGALVGLADVLAEAERPYSAASSRIVRARDLRTRKARTAQDLLQLAPGLVTAQHAGGGKAEQIFLRGFDADHGTDVNISVDGVPVNMVSHGHGQGYADLHFVIPDVVEEVGVHKGPYLARFGNFTTAGAVALHTRDHLGHNLVRLEGGSYNTALLTALYRIPLPAEAHQSSYLAGQFHRTDGPFQSPQGFGRFNLFGKVHTHLSEQAQLSLSAGGFSSAWDASGQLPDRAVRAGLVSRFGSLDDLEGGTTGRQDVNLVYRAQVGSSHLRLQGYAARYHFKLFSNFTFFLEDAERGDMIEQTDDRDIFGLDGQYRLSSRRPAGVAATIFGGGLRADEIDVSLWHSPNRVRLDPLVRAGITEQNLYLWAQDDWVLNRWLRFLLGLRGDYFNYSVEDHLERRPSALPRASGYSHQAILSPKASLIISPSRSLDLYLNTGMGFHTNDARDVVIGRRVADLARRYRLAGLAADSIDARLEAGGFDPQQQTVGTLPRAIGGEVGFRAHLGRRLTLGSALWGLDLEREFVYAGDGGFTEQSGRSRRYGVDLEVRLQAVSWLSADADLNLARAFLRDEPEGANAVPLAPRVTSTGGVSAHHPSGLEAALRYVHVARRPANEDASVMAEGYTLLHLQAAYRIGSWELSAALENILDVPWNEAQFETTSRLRGEPAPVRELHYTPGNPRNLRFGLAHHF